MRTRASMVATLFIFFQNKAKTKQTQKQKQKKWKKWGTKLAAMETCVGLVTPRQHGIDTKMTHGFPHKSETRMVQL